MSTTGTLSSQIPDILKRLKEQLTKGSIDKGNQTETQVLSEDLNKIEQLRIQLKEQLVEKLTKGDSNTIKEIKKQLREQLTSGDLATLRQMKEQIKEQLTSGCPSVIKQAEVNITQEDLDMLKQIKEQGQYDKDSLNALLKWITGKSETPPKNATNSVRCAMEIVNLLKYQYTISKKYDGELAETQATILAIDELIHVANEIKRNIQKNNPGKF